MPSEDLLLWLLLAVRSDAPLRVIRFVVDTLDFSSQGLRQRLGAMVNGNPFLNCLVQLLLRLIQRVLQSANRAFPEPVSVVASVPVTAASWVPVSVGASVPVTVAGWVPATLLGASGVGQSPQRRG